MTKKAFVELVKRAKSAKDKAEELALMAGKPTSTGVAAGAGLATLLAAAGAIARSGEDPDNTSVLSNPLLLGALGATGGYLAGNALEKAPARRSRKDLSWSSLAGLLGGAGVVGTHLATEDAERELPQLEAAFRNVSRRIPQTIGDDGAMVFHPGKFRAFQRGGRGQPSGYVLRDIVANTPQEHELLRQELREFSEARDAYQAGLLRAGRVKDAIREAGYIPESRLEDKLGRKLVSSLSSFLKHSPMSPYRWALALNPLKGRRLLNQLSTFATRRPWAAGAAGLALLAGGGKAIYDKVSD